MPDSISPSMKQTNPKDSVGTKKWRQYTTIPTTVLWELGVAMLEGARKYGRHNYRVAGVRASVYIDAAKGHIDSWWEGEDLDPDSKLSHITKAIASLTVMRDAMIQNKFVDDRPPKTDMEAFRTGLQSVVDELFERIPVAKAAYLEGDQYDKPAEPTVIADAEEGKQTGDTHHVNLTITTPNSEAFRAALEHIQHDLRIPKCQIRFGGRTKLPHCAFASGCGCVIKGKPVSPGTVTLKDYAAALGPELATVAAEVAKDITAGNVLVKALNRAAGAKKAARTRKINRLRGQGYSEAAIRKLMKRKE